MDGLGCKTQQKHATKGKARPKNKTMQQQKGKQWQTRHKKAKKAKTKKQLKQQKQKCKKGKQTNRRPKRATSTKTIRNESPTFSLFWAWFRRFALSAPPEPIPKKARRSEKSRWRRKIVENPSRFDRLGFLAFFFLKRKVLARRRRRQKRPKTIENQQLSQLVPEVFLYLFIDLFLCRGCGGGERSGRSDLPTPP